MANSSHTITLFALLAIKRYKEKQLRREVKLCQINNSVNKRDFLDAFSFESKFVLMVKLFLD